MQGRIPPMVVGSANSERSSVKATCKMEGIRRCSTAREEVSRVLGGFRAALSKWALTLRNMSTGQTCHYHSSCVPSLATLLFPVRRDELLLDGFRHITYLTIVAVGKAVRSMVVEGTIPQSSHNAHTTVRKVTDFILVQSRAYILWLLN